MISEELALARDAVAYGCVKYADLSQTRTQDYVFSFDRVRSILGNLKFWSFYILQYDSVLWFDIHVRS